MVRFTSTIERYLSLRVILGLGFLARLGILFFYPDQNFPDANGYITSGKAFFETGLLTSDFHMPLYVIWTHLLGGGIWLKFMDILMSTASIWLIYLLSLELFREEIFARISAFISALYPHFLFYATSRLTESSFVFVILIGLLMLYREKYVWASVLLALSILIRPTFDVFNPLLIFLFAYGVHKGSLWGSFKKVLVYGGVYATIMSPWWVHNHLKYGEFVRLNLGDGHVLYSGNNPLNKSGGGVVQGGKVVDLDMSQFSHIKNPVTRNKALKAATIDYIWNNPKRFVELAGLKFIRFWRLWPHTLEYQSWYIIASSLLSYGIVLLLSLLFTLFYMRPYFRVLLPLYLFTGYLTAVHMVTIGSIRYRFPIEPFLVILAGYILGRVLKGREEQSP